MSNDDFWTKLASGHTNTVLAGSMDAHLSGKTIDESFGTVRSLVNKTATTLPSPGDQFKALSHYTDIAGMGQYNSTMWMTFFVNPDGSASAIYGGEVQTEKSEQLSPKDVSNLFLKGRSRGLNPNTHLSDPKIVRRHRQASEGVLRSSFLPDEVLDGTKLFLTAEKGKYIVHTRFQKWFASKNLAKAERVFEEMLLGKLPRSKMAFPIRVASLGDLTQFLKRADGKLIHKSTNDLWSYSKDADGNFLVERLFDDEGEPLKG